MRIAPRRTNAGLLKYIEVTATMELIIFYLEDCTTLFIWYITGSYKSINEFGEDEADKSSEMNLVTTMISASISALALIVTSVMQASKNGSCFGSDDTKGKKCFIVSKMLFNYATIAVWSVYLLTHRATCHLHVHLDTVALHGPPPPIDAAAV